MTTTIAESDIPNLAGRQLEPSPWLEITQQRVDQFADATNDHQFIHVDPERAAQTPFGGPIAHGFLSLSLLSYLNAQSAIVPENLVMGINYGFNNMPSWPRQRKTRRSCRPSKDIQLPYSVRREAPA